MVQKNIPQIMAAAQDAMRLIDMAAKTGSQYAVEVGVSNYIEAVTDKVVLFKNLTNKQQDMFTIGTFMADREEFYNDLNAVAFSVP